MAWMDSWWMWRDGMVDSWSWWMWRDGMDGQLVNVKRERGWTAGGCGERAWMDSWWTWRDGVDGQLVDV